MNRCFELAQKGKGKTRSNPMVGALLVHEDKIISEGYHAYYGGPHAEVNCFNALQDKSLIQDSILYVSLEPCNFHGKTPPCTDLILNSGIKQVVIGSADVNPKVRFQGMDFLRSQEIKVINLNWVEKQKSLNIRFIINQTQKEPFFIGKLAYSQDGFIGRIGERVKITCQEVDSLSHKLRSEVDAILVGKNTWLNDHPELTARFYPTDFQPDTIVLQHDDDQTIIGKDGRLTHYISTLDSTDLKRKIFGLGYRNVLVEGGAEVFRFFINNLLFHEIHTFENQNLILRSGIASPQVISSNYNLIEEKNYFQHLICQYLRNDLPTS